MRSMKFTLLALAVAIGLSAQSPNSTTTVITGSGSQNGSSAFKIGELKLPTGTGLNDLGITLKPIGLSVGMAGGSQSTLGTLNMEVKGINQSGALGDIKTQGFTTSNATQGNVMQLGGPKGDQVIGSTATGTGKLENFISVELKPLGNGVTAGAVKDNPNLIKIQGEGTMQHGSQALFGNLTTVTTADVASWQKKVDALDPKSATYAKDLAALGEKPVIGNVVGFSNGGFATTSGMGNFTFDGVTTKMDTCGNGTQWLGGGKIDTTGTSTVKQLFTNGNLSGYTSTGISITNINVPVNPTGLAGSSSQNGTVVITKM